MDRPPDLQRVLNELERLALELERLAEWLNDLEQRLEGMAGGATPDMSGAE